MAQNQIIEEQEPFPTDQVDMYSGQEEIMQSNQSAEPNGGNMLVQNQQQERSMQVAQQTNVMSKRLLKNKNQLQPVGLSFPDAGRPKQRLNQPASGSTQEWPTHPNIISNNPHITGNNQRSANFLKVQKNPMSEAVPQSDVSMPEIRHELMANS